MKIRTRKVTVSKSAEEVLKIMKGASCPWARRWFDAHSFSFNRVVRGNGRISLIPVYGTVRELENQTEVTLEIHANAVCYLWGMISCAGVLLLLWQCILGGPGWRFSALFLLIGIVGCGIPVMTASHILDQLEIKLKRDE